MRAAAPALVVLAWAGAAGAEPRAPLSTLAEIPPALSACWETPPALARLEAGEVTLRLGLRRDGSLQGAPRVTFSSLSATGEARRIIASAALDAVGRCTPLPLTAGLGAAVAGRPFTIRFTIQGPKGQGV